MKLFVLKQEEGSIIPFHQQDKELDPPQRHGDQDLQHLQEHQLVVVLALLVEVRNRNQSQITLNINQKVSI